MDHRFKHRNQNHISSQPQGEDRFFGQDTKSTNHRKNLYSTSSKLRLSAYQKIPLRKQLSK